MLETVKRPVLIGRAFDWQPLWLPLSVMGVVAIAATFWPGLFHGFDLYAYWTVDPAAPYSTQTVLNDLGGFRYAPPIALLFAPLGLLPWDIVVVGWLALQLACLYYFAGRWFLALCLLPPVWLDLMYGNVHVIFAALIVASFRHSSAWSFPLLTKVTPGVGALWLVGRREWRSLAILGGVLGTIVLASLAVQGVGIWLDWLNTLRAASALPLPADAVSIPLLPRVLLAAGLVLWGGWTGRRWTVPVAFVLATPTLWLISTAPLVSLVAVAPRWRSGRWSRRTTRGPVGSPSSP